MLYIPFTLTAVLVLNRVFRRTPRWFNTFCKFVGAVSLEAYLIHIHFVLRYVEPHHLGYWPTFAVTVAVTMPLAWLLHKASSAVSDRLLAVAMRHSGDGTLPHGRDNVSAKDN